MDANEGLSAIVLANNKKKPALRHLGTKMLMARWHWLTLRHYDIDLQYGIMMFTYLYNIDKNDFSLPFDGIFGILYIVK